nr:uncharacterized protein LOC115268554 [Aedes albopictus]
MELEACEVLADYSLQEAPFYEAPLKVGPPQPAITPQLLHQTTPQQQHHHHQQPPLQRQSVSPFSLSSFRSALLGSTTSGGSMAASSLMLNSSGGSIVAVGGVGGGGKLMQHLGNSGSSVPRLQQPPSRPPPALVQSSALGGGLAKTKKFKKSVSFLPTIVQSHDGDGHIQLKQEPLDDLPHGGIRNIQKVPSLSDLSDPEASLGKSASIAHVHLFLFFAHSGRVSHLFRGIAFPIVLQTKQKQ